MSESTYQNLFEAGMELPPERKYYFNGFTVANSPMDMIIVLTLNNQPVAVLNTPHSVAKTLTAQVNALLDDFQRKTNLNVLRMDEVNELLEKAGKKEG